MNNSKIGQTFEEYSVEDMAAMQGTSVDSLITLWWPPITTTVTITL